MDSLPQWFVSTLLVLIILLCVLVLIRIAQGILGQELKHLLGAMRSELVDLWKRKITVGSVNLIGALVLTVVGGFVTILMGMQKIIGLIIAALGNDKGNELLSPTNYFIFLYICAAYLIISLIAVLVDQSKRK